MKWMCFLWNPAARLPANQKLRMRMAGQQRRVLGRYRQSHSPNPGCHSTRPATHYQQRGRAHLGLHPEVVLVLTIGCRRASCASCGPLTVPGGQSVTLLDQSASMVLMFACGWFVCLRAHCSHSSGDALVALLSGATACGQARPQALVPTPPQSSGYDKTIHNPAFAHPHTSVDRISADALSCSPCPTYHNIQQPSPQRNGATNPIVSPPAPPPLHSPA